MSATNIGPVGLAAGEKHPLSSEKDSAAAADWERANWRIELVQWIGEFQRKKRTFFLVITQTILFYPPKGKVAGCVITYTHLRLAKKLISCQSALSPSNPVQNRINLSAVRLVAKRVPFISLRLLRKVFGRTGKKLGRDCGRSNSANRIHDAGRQRWVTRGTRSSSSEFSSTLSSC